MKRTLLLYGVAAAAGVAATLAMPNRSGTQTQVSAKIVLQSDLRGGIIEETLVREASFAPCAATPWHIHPDGHEVSHLLEGALAIEVEGQGKGSMLSPGQGVHISPRADRRHCNGEVPVVRLKGTGKPVMVSVQALVSGRPRRRRRPPQGYFRRRR
jgi:quercetin dioxygenase-like cupin family protein